MSLEDQTRGWSTLDDIFPTEWCFDMSWARRPSGWLQMAWRAGEDRTVFVVTSDYNEKSGLRWLHATSWGGQEAVDENIWTPYAWRMAEGAAIAPDGREKMGIAL